eukprot:s1314_g15.t1
MMPFLNDEEFKWTAEMQSNRFVAGLSKKKNDFGTWRALLGDPRAELDWSDFAGRLLSRVRTPWLTRQGVADIFSQLQVRSSNSPGQMQPVVRVPDLVQALLGSEDFAVEAARRVLRVVAREARHRGQDVGKLCLGADTKRVGSLNLQQLSSVLSSLCPGMLAEADVGLLFWRFSGGGGFAYDQLQAALKEERNAAAEHLLLRGLPVLIDKTAEFEAASKAHDLGRTGKLSAAQLRGALARLNLFGGDMAEVDEFAQLLAQGCKRDASNFEYASLVAGGTWKGPSVKDAIARVCGEASDAQAKRSGKPSKRHLLSLLYYKTAEASKKLGMSRQRAFEGLDQGNKGFLNAEDLRAAVLQVVGGDETLTLKDLELPPATKLTLQDFEKRLNFDFGKLSKCINKVFGDEAVIAESDFTSRLSHFAGVDKATSQTWLQLMYPEGLPEGIGRGACEMFLATTPACEPFTGCGVVKFLTKGQRRGGSMLSMGDSGKSAPQVRLQGAGRLPHWEAVPRARSLLRSRLSEKDADQILQAITEASAKYAAPGPEEVCILAQRPPVLTTDPSFASAPGPPPSLGSPSRTAAWSPVASPKRVRAISAPSWRPWEPLPETWGCSRPGAEQLWKLGSEEFAMEAARRVLRVVAREARHRGEDVNDLTCRRLVGKLCLGADTKRVGSLNLQQLSSVLSSLCPGVLSKADVGLLFWRFSGSGGFSYRQLEAALKEERNAAAEHLLLRGLPVLIDKAAEFEAASKDHDTGRTGKLSAAQLRGALARLNLFGGDMTEVDEFAQLLAEGCKRDASNFDYASLVAGGTWKGPSVRDAIARVCGEASEAQPSKRHLLSILYYKTAEASKKLGLSRQRAFQGLDRGNKGFLNAEDLRAAVLQVVGGDETLTLEDLGLPPATRLTLQDFEKRLNFDFGQLSRCINEVFGDEAVIAESDFSSRLSHFAGVDKARSKYPEGLPEGIGRRACEMFLATTPACAPSEGVQQVRQGPDLRAAVPRARSLLRSRLSEKDADQILQAITEASAKYPEDVSPTRKGDYLRPFRPALGVGLPERESSPLGRPPVLTMDPSFASAPGPPPHLGRPAAWSPVASPRRVRAISAPSWRPWEPPLPETWGCSRGPVAEQLWKLGLRPDGPELPGVENDVSETALRAASKLSDTELQLRSLAGNEEEQLQQLRARHQQNLESLGLLQKSMLLPSLAPDAAFSRLDSAPAPSSPQWQCSEGSALHDLVAASAAPAAPAAPEVAGLSAGPLPGPRGPRPPGPPGPPVPRPGLCSGAPSCDSTMAMAVEAMEMETAGPLPPPEMDGEAFAATEGRLNPPEAEERLRTEETTVPLDRV